ncbi:hypothetical protein L5G28_07780 [Gordonia sp. HY285]|uniref:hypothetical protein n=1 Tax=Gordonia liuliyuniae TaxID=2911517 RepID=UPI001F26BF95|nr:hypothetical protein [Gordonia liuliyuniae]MCF8610061.1 hypothetical protein [Gordonia liuliyuniae]
MGFCGWAVTIPADLADEWQAAPAELRERAQQAAGRILWTLTGQVFGTCPETVRPCFQPQDHTTYRGAGAVFWPGLLTGDPAASGPCGCSEGCSEVGYDRVALPGPIASITEVVVDGEVVAPADYRIENHRWLHRVDGGRWPTHQDLHAPDDGPGAFTIRYERGLPIPADGLYAGGRLAVELLRGLSGGVCALPSGATSVSRQGITVELADMREWFTNGVTGVESVDLWIMSVNPFKSKRPGRVTSPDSPRYVRSR